MSEAWKEKAVEIGTTIHCHALAHPELKPLVTAYVNFARKRGLDGAGSLVISRRQMKEKIDRQSEEIAALEHRIKTLLER